MDAVQATSLAECIEHRLGATESGRVEAFAIPRRKASTRRSTRWCFLIVTNLPEDHVRDTLREMTLEVTERRGPFLVFVAWPDQSRRLYGATT